MVCCASAWAGTLLWSRLQVIGLSLLYLSPLQGDWRGSLQCLHALTSSGLPGSVTAHRLQSASAGKGRRKTPSRCVSPCCMIELTPMVSWSDCIFLLIIVTLDKADIPPQTYGTHRNIPHDSRMRLNKSINCVCVFGKRKKVLTGQSWEVKQNIKGCIKHVWVWRSIVNRNVATENECTESIVDDLNKNDSQGQWGQLYSRINSGFMDKSFIWAVGRSNNLTTHSNGLNIHSGEIFVLCLCWPWMQHILTLLSTRNESSSQLKIFIHVFFVCLFHSVSVFLGSLLPHLPLSFAHMLKPSELGESPGDRIHAIAGAWKLNKKQKKTKEPYQLSAVVTVASQIMTLTSLTIHSVERRNGQAKCSTRRQRWRCF